MMLTYHANKVHLSILLILLAFVVLTLLSCSQDNVREMPDSTNKSTLEQIYDNKVLHVGYVNFPPIIYRNTETGDVEGHFVLAIEELAKQLDAECRYTEATWSTFVAGLQNRQFDISIAPTFSTIPRAASVSFTRPLMYVGSSAIVRKGETRFSTLEDIDVEGIVIAVTQGEAGHEYAKANIKNAQILVQSQGDQTLTFSQVLAKRADIALGDVHVISQFAKEHPGEATDLFADNPYNLTAVCWAVRPADVQLLNFLNTAIDVLETTGKLAEYERAYDISWLHQERKWIKYSH